MSIKYLVKTYIGARNNFKYNKAKTRLIELDLENEH